jgi:hypothetical protein
MPKVPLWSSWVISLWFRCYLIRNIHNHPLWRSWSTSLCFWYIFTKEYTQSSSMELLGYFLMILAIFNKGYTQKSSGAWLSCDYNSYITTCLFIYTENICLHIVFLNSVKKTLYLYTSAADAQPHSPQLSIGGGCGAALPCGFCTSYICTQIAS